MANSILVFAYPGSATSTSGSNSLLSRLIMLPASALSPKNHVMQLYEYQELKNPNELRLLSLLPGKRSDEIQCELLHSLLTDAPSYEALSYVWGDDSKPHNVSYGDRRIPVTESLFVALQHLRYEDEPRHLWTDAVCMNQSSDIEKNHQLALMASIYTEADRVLIWLGEDTEEEAKRIFDIVRPLLEHRYDEEALLDALNVQAPKFTTEKGLKEMTRDFSTLLNPIFEKPWWSRLWVIQEYAFAKEAWLIYGSESISMDEFGRLMHTAKHLNGFRHKDATPSHIIRNLFCLVRVKGTLDRRPKPILELIRLSSRFQYTDTRDRVFALLGLADTPEFAADYTLSEDETFRRFAVWALESIPDFAVFSYARGLIPSKWDIPSWAPSPDMESLSVPLSDRVRKFKPRATANDKYRFNDDGRLCLTACIFDEIAEIADEPIRASKSQDLRKALLRCAEVAGISPSQENRLEDETYKRFALAMTMHRKSKSRRVTAGTEMFQIRRFHDYFETRTDSTCDDGEETLDNESTKTIRGLMDRMGQKRYFARTREGRFAWIHYKTEPGDPICLLRVARVPYVLCKEEDGSYQMVGECWLEGMMEENTVDFDSPDFEWKEICLA